MSLLATQNLVLDLFTEITLIYFKQLSMGQFILLVTQMVHFQYISCRMFVFASITSHFCASIPPVVLPFITPIFLTSKKVALTIAFV